MQKTGNFIQINGKKFPYPARGLNQTTVTFVNSGRNANAEVIGEVIGRPQQKLDAMVWPWLDAKTWSEMCQEFNKFYITVRFFDMNTNDFITLKMYVGDRSAEPYWIDENDRVTFYKNCKCNIIDLGVQ